MPKELRVQAPPEKICPMEGGLRKGRIGAAAVTVPDNPYYRRLLAEGSLLLAPPAKAAKSGGDK